MHSSAIESGLEEMLTNHPHMGAEIAQAKKRLRAGYYPADIVDAIFQKSQPSVSLEDAFAFAIIWSWILSGKVGLCTIEVGAMPNADRMREENQTALADLPAPFAAHVALSSKDDDGALRWERPVLLERTTVDECDCSEEHMCDGAKVSSWECGPSSVALEIGTTSASRTWAHLIMGPGVARWPYGSKSIVVLRSHPSLHELLDYPAAAKALQ